ncbi:MAG TPA: hypothetical protein VEY88_13320 [Archangium sp.]|nr:hypothetical protein [Archangium sp.]
MTPNLRPLALAVTLLSTLVSPAPASAETTATHVFESVESYNILGDSSSAGVEYIELTGVIQGEGAPRTVRLTYAPKTASGTGTDLTSSKRTFERCERLALLAMSKPGQYLLAMRQERIGTGGYGTTYHIGCKLTVRVP